MNDMGCPYRKWHWHDGGPDHVCTKDGLQNTSCKDSYSDWYQCEEVKPTKDNMMTFNEYQSLAKSTDIYPPDKALDCHILGLTNEAGEVAGKLKKIYRDKDGLISPTDVLEIAKELGDVLWYLTCTAYDLEISLEDIAIMNIDKLADRKERNKLGGSGDHR